MNNVVKGDTLKINNSVKRAIVQASKQIIANEELPRNASKFEDYWFMHKTPEGRVYDVNIYENCADDGLKISVFDTVFNGEVYDTIGNEWCQIGYIKDQI
tara:strand:- start:3737 stop:4036 length:300 start_codon:yes stop_codon:yes gene_type:complete